MQTQSVVPPHQFVLLRTACFLSTTLRRYTISRTNQVVVSYVWYSTIAPGLEVRAPEEWKEVAHHCTPVLLFMIWPHQEQIWLHSPEFRWEKAEIGDEFSSEWKRVEKASGEYVLVQDSDTVKLIRQDTIRRKCRRGSQAQS